LSITFGNGIFVAVADYNPSGSELVATSPDGITWTPRTMPLGGEAVTYGNGVFVAVGYGTIATSDPNVKVTAAMTSADGITWAARSLPNTGGVPWLAAAYGNGTFVALAPSRSSSYSVGASSPDGITWTTVTMPANKNWTPDRRERPVAAVRNGFGRSPAPGIVADRRNVKLSFR
jgi:hypothetical protein